MKCLANAFVLLVLSSNVVSSVSLSIQSSSFSSFQVSANQSKCVVGAKQKVRGLIECAVACSSQADCTWYQLLDSRCLLLYGNVQISDGLTGSSVYRKLPWPSECETHTGFKVIESEGNKYCLSIRDELTRFAEAQELCHGLGASVVFFNTKVKVSAIRDFYGVNASFIWSAAVYNQTTDAWYGQGPCDAVFRNSSLWLVYLPPSNPEINSCLGTNKNSGMLVTNHCADWSDPLRTICELVDFS